MTDLDTANPAGPSRPAISPPPPPSPPSPPPDEEPEPEVPSSDPWTAEDLAAVAAAEQAERQRLSFERSLAGPSVGKAGLQRNQTEINRIIAEASKGSKFYENQVRKDKELTEKIKWFCAKRDELLKQTPREKILADADRILMEVEAERDLSQTIVHVDVDAFYAAVECKRDPSLKGKAFGVGQGVLTTASYEARKFGCRSGMAGFIAKKLCPHIILTPLHFDLYTEASRKIREVLLRYDENLMMAGLDEGYLNITAYIKQHEVTALEAVERLRAEVEEATGLTISAGIAPNRMLAKICSDKNKPNGVYMLDFDRATIVKFMHDLPVRKIPGFGRVTERCLEGFGVETCGDIYRHRAELLVMNHWLGFRGLCKAHLGIADNTVQPYKREERKSVGVERTFRDKWEDEDILQELASIAQELEDDLKRLQYSGKTVTVKYKLHTYESKTRALSVKKNINTKDEILPIALDLMKKELPVRIRLLGIRLSNLKDLTVPETGIKDFFSKSASSSPQKSKPRRSPEVVDLSQIDEAVEAGSSAPDRQDAVASGEAKREGTGNPSREASREGTREASREASTAELDGAVDTDPSPSNPGPMCPICSRTLGPETSNAQLNEHIDLCLNRGVEGIETSPVKRRVEPTQTQKRSAEPTATQGKRKKKRKEEPTVLDWLKRR